MIASERQSEALVIRAVKFLVATIRGEIVGFATLFLTNPTTGSPKAHIPKLSDCFVAASCRSRGIGRALVGAREDLARLEGHRRLFVSVGPVENPRWLAFFQGRGYKALHDAPYRSASLETRTMAESRKCSFGGRTWSWRSLRLLAAPSPPEYQS